MRVAGHYYQFTKESLRLAIPVIGVRADFRWSGNTQGFSAMLYFSAARLINNDTHFLEAIVCELKALGIEQSTHSLST